MADGIIAIDKPEGFTSFDVIAKLRKLYNTKKIGHTGTLDPMATGVLCVFLGHATKFIPYIQNSDKTYIGTIKFGIMTDTGDITGEVIQTTDVRPSRETLKKVISEFIGEITQIPPMYSAIKVDGVPLYRRARQGQEVEVPPRQVTIHDINLVETNGDFAVVEVSCSAGTYIRTLAEDIAKKCGSLGTLTSLRRTQSGDYTLNNTVTLEELERIAGDIAIGEREKLLLSAESAFLNFPEITASSIQLKRLKNGLTQKIPTPDEGIYRVYSEGEFQGLVTSDNAIVRAVRLCNY